MRWVYLTVALMFELFLTMISISWAGSMVTAKDDAQVFVGVVSYLVIFVIFGASVIFVYKLCLKWLSANDKQKGDGDAMIKVIDATKLIVLALTVAAMSGCGKVEPGWVGIKVNQYGTQRGVEDFPVVTGRVWFNPFTEDIYKFPTFLQNVVWTKDKTEGSPNDDSITFNSIEGAGLNADIAISYGFIPEQVPHLFVEFRKDAEHITSVYIRSQVRDAFSRIASTMKVMDIFGERKQELTVKVKEDLEKNLGPKGFKFDMISIVGKIRVDDKVEQSINAVISATQKAIEAENKIKQSDAEAKQAIAVADGKAKSILKVADAQAQANDKVAKSVTLPLIMWAAVEKWDGTPPKVIGGGVPLINLDGLEKRMATPSAPPK